MRSSRIIAAELAEKRKNPLADLREIQAYKDALAVAKRREEVARSFLHDKRVEEILKGEKE